MDDSVHRRTRLGLDAATPRDDRDGAGDVALELGKFRLIGRLGQGSMGQVYLARDQVLRREVALKLLRVRRTLDDHDALLAEQFVREGRAAARLNHPGVVRVYEAGYIGRYAFIASEFIEGPNLQQLLEAAGPLDARRVCSLLADAGDALSHAHQHGIIHRDVKPANLMLGRDGRCRVTDFGLARVHDPEDTVEQPSESVGTPAFIAPEVARGRPANALSDLYSLGATAWCLLTGSPPFTAPTTAQVLRMHVTQPLPDLAALRPDLPNELIHAVQTALAKLSTQRYPDVAAFVAVLRGMTVPGHSASAMSQAGHALARALDQSRRPVTTARRVRRRRIGHGIVIGGVSLLVGLAIGTLITLHRHTARPVPPLTQPTTFAAGLLPDTPAPREPTPPTDAAQLEPLPPIDLEPTPWDPLDMLDNEPTDPPDPPEPTHPTEPTLTLTQPLSPPTESAIPPAITPPPSLPSAPPLPPQPAETAETAEPIHAADAPAVEQAPEAPAQADPQPLPTLPAGWIAASDETQLNDLAARGHAGWQHVAGQVVEARTTTTGRSFRINFAGPRGMSDFYAVCFPFLYDELQNKFGGVNGGNLTGQWVVVQGEIGNYQGRPQIIIRSLDQIDLWTPEADPAENEHHPKSPKARQGEQP